MPLPATLVAFEATFIIAILGAGVFAIRDAFGHPAAYAVLAMLAIITCQHIREMYIGGMA